MHVGILWPSSVLRVEDGHSLSPLGSSIQARVRHAANLPCVTINTTPRGKEWFLWIRAAKTLWNSFLGRCNSVAVSTPAPAATPRNPSPHPLQFGSSLGWTSHSWACSSSRLGVLYCAFGILYNVVRKTTVSLFFFFFSPFFFFLPWLSVPARGSDWNATVTHGSRKFMTQKTVLFQ